MKRTRLFCVGLAVIPVLARATDSDTALPAINFYSSVAAYELKEFYGCPITVRVTHCLRPTMAGKATGLLSAVLAGSTPGLLPVVTNNTLEITYEVMVHDKSLITYT